MVYHTMGRTSPLAVLILPKKHYTTHIYGILSLGSNGPLTCQPYLGLLALLSMRHCWKCLWQEGVDHVELKNNKVTYVTMLFEWKEGDSMQLMPHMLKDGKGTFWRGDSCMVIIWTDSSKCRETRNVLLAWRSRHCGIRILKRGCTQGFPIHMSLRPFTHRTWLCKQSYRFQFAFLNSF